ncbi:MAG: aspartate ammonia-lyase [Eubacteriales bacterium]|nr:aspartate ammonia-lyase [Eubacteriales bacterium]
MFAPSDSEDANLQQLQMRQESDSVGELELPATVYYGIQSLRAAENFPISHRGLHPCLIANLARIKIAAAKANFEAAVLSAERRDAIIEVCAEILAGEHADAFIVDEIQGGAGTSANMNMNEVIANRGSELLSGRIADHEVLHPNDHVNASQSTNDVFPSAGRLSAIELSDALINSLESLKEAFRAKAKSFAGIYKIGRTQLQDAVPVSLCHSFKAYARGIDHDIRHLREALVCMRQINLGGTAIGTGANAPKVYRHRVVPILSEVFGSPLEQADDLLSATQNLSDFVYLSGAIKAVAVTLSKISNDLRLLSSGPRAGLGELRLPPRQNGSSIMPGKINPVIPEVVSQVCFAVCGNDLCISMAAEAGQLELNAFEPVLFSRLFDSLTCLQEACDTFRIRCVNGIEAQRERIQANLEHSLYGATALAPYIGYDLSSTIAHEALRTRHSIREVALQYSDLSAEQIDEVLNIKRLIEEDENAES